MNIRFQSTFPWIICFRDHPLDRWFEQQTDDQTSSAQSRGIESRRLIDARSFQRPEDAISLGTQDELADEREAKRERPPFVNPESQWWQPDRSRRTENETYTGGQRPRPSYTDYKPELEDKYRSKGRRFPGEPLIYGQLIATGDPQLLKDEVEAWKNMALQKYNQTNKQFSTTEQTYKFLETTLGPAAMALWEAYKDKNKTEYEQLIALGNNPYNFVNRVGTLLTGADPNEGIRYEQQRMIRRLEQLKLVDYNRIKEFIVDATVMVTKAGGAYDEGLKLKVLNKLPGPLGEKLTKEYKAFQGHESLNIFQVGQFIIHRLEEECTMITASKQLKSSSTNFCKNIYTVQQYGEEPRAQARRSRSYQKPRKGYKRSRQIHTLRKSNKRAPFLQRDRHVRKWRPTRTYSRQIKCFACGEEGHVSTNCGRRNGQRNEKHDLIEAVNEDLIEIGSDLSESESIYSWQRKTIYLSGSDTDYASSESDWEKDVEEFLY